jgi:hypothetical protein
MNLKVPSGISSTGTLIRLEPGSQTAKKGNPHPPWMTDMTIISSSVEL